MLITFRCKAHSNVTMFGDIGLQLIKMLGHSGTIPGAISSEDVPEALNRLRAAIALEKQALVEPEEDDDEEEDDYIAAPVNISNRAFPLVELLNAAVKEQCEVMWDDSTNKSL
ncbi:DUF1840 domain-containing protein [Vibrio makurazakiensis]|uniref:DUF1840 domain-containing protein n=1 Tax=Vibrio makurazakiensis TaxID=2910250 RepID=UPI003D0EA672